MTLKVLVILKASLRPQFLDVFIFKNEYDEGTFLYLY